MHTIIYTTFPKCGDLWQYVVILCGHTTAYSEGQLMLMVLAGAAMQACKQRWQAKCSDAVCAKPVICRGIGLLQGLEMPSIMRRLVTYTVCRVSRRLSIISTSNTTSVCPDDISVRNCLKSSFVQDSGWAVVWRKYWRVMLTGWGWLSDPITCCVQPSVDVGANSVLSRLGASMEYLT